MLENVRHDLQEAYWKYLLLEGKRPKSVYAFMEYLGKEESEFYQYYANFEKIESAYWQATVDETINVLEQDGDYSDYPADQKLLSFLFTYITHIQGNRSRFVEHFPKPCMSLPHTLKGMKYSFKAYAKTIVSEGVREGIFADRRKLIEQYDRFMFMHFLGIIHFYIKDTSQDFQDTDAFIEKSSHLAIKSAAEGVLESGFDFVRFMAGKDDRLKGLSKMISKFIPN